MRDSAANSYSASNPLEPPPHPTWTNAESRPVPPHHGPAVVDSNAAAILPPTLTPATTTQQSVALGVFSTLWGANSHPTANAHSTVLSDPSVPAIVTHAPSPDAQESPFDLTTSTGSIPSTTTTLTNTLPPTQSAALRALNAPAFQSQASPSNTGKPAKSTSSRTSLSSQPVVVRTYSGSRHSSRPSSGVNSPRLFPGMNGHPPQNPSVLSAGLAGRSERLPSVDDFSFSAILRAVDPEIRDAIDAIAEICARSRLSLADEYDAHLPPQGEITGAGPGWASGMGALVGRGRIPRIGQGWTAAENTLMAVPEASSSSERLAGESRSGAVVSSSKKRSQSAYGSLKSVISGGSGQRKPDAFSKPDHEAPNAARAGKAAATTSDHPTVTLITSPQASKQLSLDTSSTIKEVPEPLNEQHHPILSAEPKSIATHSRNTSNASNVQTRNRSSTLSSLASWIHWPRTSDVDVNSAQELTKAEARLREMLIQSQTSTLGKGKAPMNVT